jgi:hypothetical protein
MRNARRGLIAGTLVLVAGLGATRAAGYEVGQTTSPSASCGGGYTYLQTTAPGSHYRAPFAGVITAWSHRAGASPFATRLKVGRGTGDNYAVVGQSELKAPTANQLNTYTDVRIPVQANDAIGFFFPNTMLCGNLGAAGYDYHFQGGDILPGPAVPFTAASQDLRMDISATLELDNDGDGYGDVTQDLCPSDPTTPGVCPDRANPDTTIILAPNPVVKTKKKKAKAVFGLTSSEDPASFACRLDATPFVPCASTFEVKVAKGKHIFEARAKDAAGNSDPTPATFIWQVKRKQPG